LCNHRRTGEFDDGAKSDFTEGVGGRTLTEQQVADIFGVCPATIARARKRETSQPSVQAVERPSVTRKSRQCLQEPHSAAVTADAADDLAEATIECSPGAPAQVVLHDAAGPARIPRPVSMLRAQLRRLIVRNCPLDAIRLEVLRLKTIYSATSSSMRSAIPAPN